MCSTWPGSVILAISKVRVSVRIHNRVAGERMKATMTRRARRAATDRTPLVPRVKVWLETEGHYALGFGLSQILQSVEKAGSIKQAAEDLGKSYRYIWGRIKEAERALRAQLVVTQVD